jgi:hypothetical protein
MRLRRRKSTPARAVDLLGTYLKFKAATKAAKAARKAAKGTAVYKTGKGVAKRTPFVKRLPLVAGAGLAAFAASRALRGGGHEGGTAPSV